jgi:hypothetical protein
MNGDGVHSGLLDLYKFMICSLLVRVNSSSEAVLCELGHLVNVREGARLNQRQNKNKNN